ncbi:MAG: hypothetical protein N4A49_12130 [Marinifilaceae bacterium]|jgi:hypothetical protein|nr:hypothetical protein [Marinifilaceae bacterium]
MKILLRLLEFGFLAFTDFFTKSYCKLNDTICKVLGVWHTNISEYNLPTINGDIKFILQKIRITNHIKTV